VGDLQGGEECLGGDFQPANRARWCWLGEIYWCAKNEWMLVTHNISDFWGLHTDLLAGGDGHSGLVLIRQQTLGIGEKLRRLLKLSAALSAEEMKDRAEFLSNWN
jgi:hypothetical protein